MSTRTSLAALLLVACTFGSTEDIVPHGDIDHAIAAVFNHDETGVFVAELSGGLVVAHPDSGVELERRDLSMIPVRSLAVNHADPDGVWALHDGGMVVKWNTLLEPAAIVGARPLGGASERSVCDFDVTSAEDVYITSVDTINGSDVAVLAHRDASTGVWSTVTLPGDDCVPMAYDDMIQQVVVQPGFDLQLYAPDLTLVSIVDLDEDAWCADIHDIDALGGKVLAGGMCWATDPHSRLWLFTTTTGVLEDYEHIDTEWVNSTQIKNKGTESVMAVVGGYDFQFVVSTTAIE